MKKILFSALAVTTTLLLSSCQNGSVKPKDAEAAPDKLTTQVATAPDSASQEKMLNPQFDPQQLCGIGVFKIGASKESSIAALRKTGKYVYVEKHECSNEGMPSEDYTITRILPPSIPTMVKGNMTIDYYSYYNDTTEAYIIGKYDIDAIHINLLLVEYYRNKLISVRYKKTEELENVLTTKYGPSKNSIWHNGDVVTNDDWILRREAYYTHISGSDKYLRGVCNAWYNNKRLIIDSVTRVKARNL